MVTHDAPSLDAEKLVSPLALKSQLTIRGKRHRIPAKAAKFLRAT